MSIPVDLVCDYTSPSGYGTHAREVIKALEPFVDLRLVNSRHDRMEVDFPEAEAAKYKRLTDKTRTPKVRIQFETPEHFHPQPGVFNIGFTQWETTRIYDQDFRGNARFNWVKQMNTMQAMWTSCQMAKKAFADSGVTVPTSVFTGPMDTTFYQPKLPELDLHDIVINSKDGSIIPRDQRPPVVGMIAQWTMRKNIEAFIITMLSRFKRGEIIVVLKTYASSMDEGQTRVVRERVDSLIKTVNNPDAPYVLMITDNLTDAQIAALYSSFDFYVNTSRGEGFCMPLVQAMASECFPISCGFSAPADYIRGSLARSMSGIPLVSNSEHGMNGILVNYTLAPAVGMHQVPWYKHDQSWGVIDQEDLANSVKLAMKMRADFPESYEQVCRNARRTVVEKMSPAVIGAAMFQDIVAKLS